MSFTGSGSSPVLRCGGDLAPPAAVRRVLFDRSPTGRDAGRVPVGSRRGRERPGVRGVLHGRALAGAGAVRAGRLLSGWVGATHVYEVAKLVVPAGLPARVAGRAVDAFGDGA